MGLRSVAAESVSELEDEDEIDVGSVGPIATFGGEGVGGGVGARFGRAGSGFRPALG